MMNQAQAPEKPSPPTWRGYRFGIFMGGLCAVVFLVLSLLALSTEGYGVLLPMMGALYIACPLLLVLFMTWLVYVIRDRGQMPSGVHGWMWLPPLATAMILPAYAAWDDWRKAGVEAAFPPISELHVNLTGQALRIPTRGTSTRNGAGPSMPMPADQPGQFVELTRWSGGFETLPNIQFPYRGPMLSDEFPTLPRLLGDVPEPVNEDWLSNETDAAPWSLAHPLPDVAPLLGRMRFPSVVALLQYQYFHYPDHIEVVPVLRDSADLMDVPVDALAVPLLGFFALNMTDDAIVRLEINGQGVDASPWGRAVAPHQDCRRGYARLGVAQLSLDAPLQLRWQTDQAPHAWQTATVDLPALGGETPAGARPERQQVLLYFDENGRVLAERFQAFRLSGPGVEGQFAVRHTGAPADLSRPPPCYSSLAAYDPARLYVLPNNAAAD